MATAPKRVAFLTVGQTPRTDLLPELLGWIGEGIDPHQFGALDDLRPNEVDTVAPGPKDHAIMTRLRDGTEIVVRRDWMEVRLRELLASLAPQDFDVTVILTTGRFDGLRCPGLLIEAHAVVGHGVSAIAEGARSLGVIVPVAQQAEDFHYLPRADQRLTLAHASPYAPGAIETAAREIGAVDVVVLYGIGYSNAMRHAVATATGVPVILARRLVADAVRNLL